MLSAALGLALVAPAAHAMGLGPLQVKSGLNQPLVAEIPILSATPDELAQLDVRLASPDAFSRVGLDRPLELTANLQFSVGTNAKGQPVIRVTTPGRFQEPFLSFLIEADWGKGTVTREYTALIDPPYIAPAVIRPLTTPSVATAPPVVAPPPVVVPPEPQPEPAPAPEPSLVVSEPEPTPAPVPQTLPPAPPPRPVAAQPAPNPRRLPAPPPAQPSPQPTPPPQPAPQPVPPPAQVARPGEYGPVSSGQTLWSIAESVRPDPSVTVNQVMLALQRANPDAFDQNNINRLKRGSVLRIPRQEEMASLSAAEAAVLVREQATAWRGAASPVPQPAESVAATPAPAPKPRPSTPATTTRKPSGSSQARLEIVPPAGRSGARGAQSGAAAGAGGSELRAQLTQAREDLASRETEIKDLKSRVAELEQIDKKRQQLIDVQNSELKNLQDRLRELEAKNAAARATPVPMPAPTPAPAETPAAGSETMAAETPAPTPEPGPKPKPKPKPKPGSEGPKPAATAEAAEAPAATPIWMNPFVLVGGAVIAIGLLVFGLRRRSRPAESTANGSDAKRISEDEALRASLARTRANTTPAKVPEPAPKADPESQTVKRMPGIAPTPAPAATPAPAPAATGVDADIEHAQAAIKSRPADLESHLALLRLYHKRGNAADYETAAQAMRMQVGSPTDPRWREAVVMGAALMPGHPLFSQAGWNAPRFGESEPTPAPAPPPPRVAEPVREPVAPTVATPKVAPPPAPEPVAEPEEELTVVDIDAEWDKAMSDARDTSDDSLDFESAVDDPHRVEAEVMAEDEASATRIELAKAYLDIGDLDGARSMLEEVAADGGPAAKAEAQRILKEIG
jgi:pilus assembly protein FimV